MDNKENITKSKLINYMKLYGNHFLSFSINQKSIKYFLMEEIGFIAFKEVVVGPYKKRRSVALGNPICSPCNYEVIISEFVSSYDNCSFFMCDTKVADIISKYGFYINKWGKEHHLAPKLFNLNGRRRKLLRRWKRKLDKSNYSIEEFNFDSENISIYMEISSLWLERKGRIENNFVNRPLEYENLPDTRRFHIRKGHEILGFIIFDPIYRLGKIEGYYQNIVRYRDNIEAGLTSYCLLEAIERLKVENLNIISLGVAPGIGIDSNPYKENNALYKAIRFLVKYCNFIYPAKGIHFNKKIFNFQQRDIYYGSRNNSILEFCVIYNSCKK